MPNEIEKKLLFIGEFNLSRIPTGSTFSKIQQGYLERPDREEFECRVRVESTNKNSVYTYTEKRLTKTVGVRNENEKEISEAECKNLQEAYEQKGETVRKIRYSVLFQGKVLSIDVYQDQLAPRVVCEIEFDSVEEMNSFVLPFEMFGEYIDVTGDKRYSNASLAENGFPVR